jgi:hypothetical protein
LSAIQHDEACWQKVIEVRYAEDRWIKVEDKEENEDGL